MRWVVQQQPELLDSSVVQEVEQAAAAGDINPAVQVLTVPQLTLLAAGLIPLPALLQLVEAAVAAAQQSLFSKVGVTHCWLLWCVWRGFVFL
jgi:hypothetical protein